MFLWNSRSGSNIYWENILGLCHHGSGMSKPTDSGPLAVTRECLGEVLIPLITCPTLLFPSHKTLTGEVLPWNSSWGQQVEIFLLLARVNGDEVFILVTYKHKWEKAARKSHICAQPWGLWWNKMTQNLQMLKTVITSVWCSILSSSYNIVKWPVMHIAKLACMALWRYHLHSTSAVARVTSQPTTVLRWAIQINK